MSTVPRLTPRMAATLRRASDDAIGRGHDYVGTEHVLLAFLDDPHGIAGGVIHRLGFADRVRAEVNRIMESDGYARGPDPRGAR